MDDSLFVFGKSLHDLTLSDIQSFINSNPDESLYLEYKDIRILETPDDLAKSISSFANSAGGNIIVGVNAQSEGPNPHQPFIQTTSNSKFIEDWLAKKISDKIQPAVQNVTYHRIFNDDKSEWIILIHVPPSENIPHMYNQRYYHRVDSRNVPMDHYHVERAFNSIKRPHLVPKIAVTREGMFLTVTYSIWNDSQSICKYPFVKVEILGTIVPPNAVSSSFNLNVVMNSIQYSSYHEVFYSSSTTPLFSFKILSHQPFFIKTTLAGENLKSSILCSFVDEETPNNTKLNVYNASTDLKEMSHNYSLCSRGDDILTLFAKLCISCLGGSFDQLSPDKQKEIKRAVVSDYGDD